MLGGFSNFNRVFVNIFLLLLYFDEELLSSHRESFKLKI